MRSEEDWEKEEAMQHHLPTQILRQHTSEAAPDSKEIDHKSRVAWNFFSSMYFKTGGIPWSPKGLMAGTCYVGISFYRPLGSSSTARASVAQAFNEYGDGMVLRGQDFQWDTRTLSDHHPGGNLALNKDELEHNRFR